jgi:hypothetical protein
VLSSVMPDGRDCIRFTVACALGDTKITIMSPFPVEMSLL